MSREEKFWDKIKKSSANVSFEEMVWFIQRIGFVLKRHRGSHTLFFHPEWKQIINIQNKGGQVKPYQVRQIIDIVEKFN